MKRIEVPNSDVIGNIVERTSIEIGLPLFEKADTAQLYQFVRAGIAYANEVIEASSDGVCGTCHGSGLLGDGWCPDCGGKKARTPKWTPKPGDKCAFWFSNDEVVRISVFTGFQFEGLGNRTTGDRLYRYEPHFVAEHCALLESLDEIGNPPGYFINRGRCTVCE